MTLETAALETTITLDRIEYIVEKVDTVPSNRPDFGRRVSAILVLCKRGKRGGILKARWLAPRFEDGTTGRARRWL